MKRVIALALAALLAIAVFAGCGGNGGDAAKSVNLSTVMDTINTANGLSLEKLDTADKLNRYYSIDEKDVKQFAAEMDKSNTDAPVEIVLVEAVDADAAGRVETALNTRYNSILRTYNSYTPEKVSMVEACKVTKDGNYVTMIVADNAAAMLKTFQDSIK